MAVKTCNNCQAPIAPNVIYCGNCGRSQLTSSSVTSASQPNTVGVAVERCPVCSTPKSGLGDFCVGCGNSFGAPVSAAPPPAPFSPPPAPVAPAAVATPSKPTCPKCSKLYETKDRFCRHCGYDIKIPQKQSSARFCTRCGVVFEPGEQFCKNCASNLDESNHTVIGMPPPSLGTQPATEPIPSFTSETVPSPMPSFTSQTSVVPQDESGFPSPISASFGKTTGEPGRSEGEASFVKRPTKAHWVSPSAAIFALICFFLPWLEFSCGSFTKYQSGADLASRDETFIVFPVAAIVILVSYGIFKAVGRVWYAIPFVVISSLAALGVLVSIADKLNQSTTVFGVKVSAASLASSMGFKPQVGAFGTALAFIIALIGAIFLRPVTTPGSPPQNRN